MGVGREMILMIPPKSERRKDAVLWMRHLASQEEPIGEPAVLGRHRRMVARSEPAIAGVYRQHARRISGSTAIFSQSGQDPAADAEVLRLA